MMKSQTKMTNLTSKIQKLARVLNKFSINDIQQLIPISNKEILATLKELVAGGIIKKLSPTEFLYIKYQKKENIEIINKHKLSKEEKIFEQKLKNKEWLTVEEVMALTKQKRETIRRKCKNQTYESINKKDGRYKIYLVKTSSIKQDYIKGNRYQHYNFKRKKKKEKITLENLKFETVSEQKIYDNATDAQKRYLAKYITVFRLAKGLSGRELDTFLKDLGKEHKEYKVSYSMFRKVRAKYNKGGLKDILPKYGDGHRGKTIIPKEMYEDFKKIYLSNKRLSLGDTIKELENLGYDQAILPSDKTFNRLLLKEYSREYINAIRETPFKIANIDLRTNDVKIKAKTLTIPKFKRYINAAKAYLEKYKNNKSNTHICRKGYIKNHLNPFFKKYNFEDITNETIIEYVKYKMSKGYSLASIKRFLATLSSIMTEYNIPNDLILSTSNMPIMEKDCKILNQDKINSIIKTQDEKLWILCLGINPAELEALEYSDIDFENRTIKIDKCIFNNKVEKYRKLYKIRSLKIPKIIFKTILKNKTGRIFDRVKIDKYDVLVNTHVKLLLDKNIQINIISKNLGFQKLTDFETRFQKLLPHKLDDNFEIIE